MDLKVYEREVDGVRIRTEDDSGAENMEGCKTARRLSEHGFAMELLQGSRKK